MEIGIHACLFILITVLFAQCETLCLPTCAANYVCSGGTCICNDASCADICGENGTGNCQNGGTCGSTSPKTCTCVSGYIGPLCETESNIPNNPPVKKHPYSTTAIATTTTTVPTTTTTTTTTGTTTSQNNRGSSSMCPLHPLIASLMSISLYKIMKYRTRNLV